MPCAQCYPARYGQLMPGGRLLATARRPTYSRVLLVLARAWGWAAVPALAVVAYAPVLGIGFLSDDFALLGQGTRDVTPDLLLPVPYALFYRPVGTLLIWHRKKDAPNLLLVLAGAVLSTVSGAIGGLIPLAFLSNRP